jgi:Cu(I)/Ag(I) efflux system membrane fusion protein
MTVSKLITIFILFLTLSACGGENREMSDQQEQQQNQTQPQQQLEQQESDIPYNFRLEMETLLGTYFELKNAVVESDMEAASMASGKLSAFTSSVLDDVLGSKNLGLWQGIARIIRTESDKLVTSESLDEMRIYFEHISRTVIRIADSFDPAGGPYYLMACDEAATGDNQWLSREEEVGNPYQTSADAGCGEIVERFMN